MSYLVCGIYEKRPPVCKRYPWPESYLPESCGFRYTRGERQGGCYLECQASCCMMPRQNGDPGGVPLPEIAGGMPCKHLITVDKAPEGATVEKPEE